MIEPCIREAAGKVLAQPWYFGSECGGGFAQFAAVASRHPHRIESPFDSISLASFPCSYSTAENMLTRANVRSGERVLVTGASGGVGSAAVQLAGTRGAEVIAVTSSSKAAALREIEADEIVDRDADILDCVGAGCIDVVVDLVAGGQWSAVIETMRPGGRYAVAGAIGGANVDLDVRTLYLKDLSFFGCTVLDDGVFASLVCAIEEGRIDPLVAATYSLHDIVEAQAAFNRKDHIGKIVLSVD